MRASLFRGPALLLLYQTVPVSVVPDTAGNLRIQAAWADGQFAYESFDCAGDLVESHAVPFQTAGGRVDWWPDDEVHLVAFGGSYRWAITGVTQAYGGGLAAWEGKRLGLGVGFAEGVHPDSGVAALYIRSGALDGLHVRFERAIPAGAWGVTGVDRIVLAFNQGQLRRVNGFVGLGTGVTDKTAFVASLGIPVTRSVDLTLEGMFAQGEATQQRAVGAGVRVYLGGP